MVGNSGLGKARRAREGALHRRRAQCGLDLGVTGLGEELGASVFPDHS